MEEDVKEILRIPLLRKLRKDEIIWHFDKKRLYSMKHGY